MPTHSLEFNHVVCEFVLRWLDEMPNGEILLDEISEAIRKHGGAPPDYHEVIRFLVEEGLLQQDRYRLKITYKGRIKIHRGGFRKAYLRERLMGICTVIAAVAGIVAVILQVCFHFLG